MSAINQYNRRIITRRIRYCLNLIRVHSISVFAYVNTNHSHGTQVPSMSSLCYFDILSPDQRLEGAVYSVEYGPNSHSRNLRSQCIGFHTTNKINLDGGNYYADKLLFLIVFLLHILLRLMRLRTANEVGTNCAQSRDVSYKTDRKRDSPTCPI